MDSRNRIAAEWRVGWGIVLACGVGVIAHSAHSYTMGMFIKPLEAAFGWSRTEVTSAMTVFSVGNLVFAPLTGLFADRFGARRLVLIGAPLLGLAMALLGLTGPAIWTWWAAWAFLALVGPLMSTVMWTIAITRTFDKTRASAIAVAYCGAGVMNGIWPPLTLWLITSYGWRGAYFAIGGITMIVVTSIMYVFFRGPATDPRIVTEGMRTGRHGEQISGLTSGMTLIEALRSLMFWRISLVICVIAATVSSVMVHLPAFLSDAGLSPMHAATATSFFGIAAVVGRLSGGVLLDRFHARYVAAGFFCMPALACLILLNYNGSYWEGASAAFLVGMVAGIEGELLSLMLSRYFGLRAVGAVYGAAFSIFGIGYGNAPTVAALVFDRTGSYDAGLMILLAALVICIITALTYGPYPTFDGERENEQGQPLPS